MWWNWLVLGLAVRSPLSLFELLDDEVLDLLYGERELDFEFLDLLAVDS